MTAVDVVELLPTDADPRARCSLCGRSSLLTTAKAGAAPVGDIARPSSVLLHLETWTTGLEPDVPVMELSPADWGGDQPLGCDSILQAGED